MSRRIFQVDSFTDKPFGGNPAGVCVMDAPADEAWMQNIAMEMNLSETAFLYPLEEGYNLRWFTPTVEVDLCGHATLATAHILWSEDYLSQDQQARFSTKSGLLTADRNGDLIELNFPASPPTQVEPPDGLLDALGIEEVLYVGKTSVKFLIEVPSEDIVRNLKPDFPGLLAQEPGSAIVTSMASTEGFDFVSRFFAPQMGINEDPVTGAAHCVLGPYWMRKLGRDSFKAYQASARGGVVHVRVDGERIVLGGQAVTVLRCELE